MTATGRRRRERWVEFLGGLFGGTVLGECSDLLKRLQVSVCVAATQYTRCLHKRPRALTLLFNVRPPILLFLRPATGRRRGGKENERGKREN